MPEIPNIFLQRTSPAGDLEYIVEDAAKQKELFPDTAKARTFLSTSYYRPEFANDPSTQNHERMHVGQFWYGLTEPGDTRGPSLSELQPLLQTHPDYPGLSEYFAAQHADPQKQADEIPAYLFENYSPEFQPQFNAYMDFLDRRSPDRVHHMEVRSPFDYIKNYPPAVQPTMPQPPPLANDPYNLFLDKASEMLAPLDRWGNALRGNPSTRPLMR